MKASKIAAAFGALAHQHRLAAYRLLVERGPAGLAAGEIATHLGLVPSSLTFHVQALQRVGLITRRRSGRHLFYAADFAVMNSVIGYLTKNCCGQRQAALVHACQPGRVGQ